MKFLRLILALSSALWALSSPAAAQTGSKNLSLLGTANRLLTGSVFTVDAGATFTVSGVLSGTPTGGTLNLSNTTLTLPATVSGGTSSLQPLDADLTAIAALTTTANGRSLLTASALTAAGLGLTNGAAIDTLGAGTGTALTALNASNLGSGTVPAARFPALTGEATTSAGAVAVTLTNSAVIGKVLTGYASAAGTVAATDTILGAVGKLNGNTAALANPRSPRQALVMDASGFAAVGTFTFGLNDLSLSFIISTTSATNSAQRVFFSGADEPNTVNIRYNPSTRTFSSANTGLNYVAPDNLPAHYVWVRTSQVSALWRNGVIVQSGITDSTNYASGNYVWGGNGVSAGLAATYSCLFLFNRALSAAEVLALYQEGAPRSADYGPFGTNDASASVPGASNTSMVTGDNSTFASATGYWSLVGGATISGGVANIPNGGYISRSGISLAAKRYRITATVATNNVLLTNLDTLSVSFPVGTTTQIVTQLTANPTIFAFQNISGGAATVDNVTIVPVGLLSAPDAQQPGNGFQRRDMSGNRADLPLTATGVTHLLPSDAPNSVRASLSWAGTHEAKSLLGQIALPLNAVITSIVTTASVGSSGSGLTVGSVTTPALFVAANTYTTARKLHTLATALPAGTAANDLNIVLDPDTANYTGTIQVAVNYLIAP